MSKSGPIFIVVGQAFCFNVAYSATHTVIIYCMHTRLNLMSAITSQMGEVSVVVMMPPNPAIFCRYR